MGHTIDIGDWIRFQLNGALVIGVVNYVDDSQRRYPYERQLITDVGRCYISEVLESRRASLS